MKELVDECGCVLGLHMVDCPLHSTAPELLEACKQAQITIFKFDNGKNKTYQALEQAIAKAEGRDGG